MSEGEIYHDNSEQEEFNIRSAKSEADQCLLECSEDFNYKIFQKDLSVKGRS